MAEISVLRTNGNEKDILEKSPDTIHLFIAALDNCKTAHEMGDILTNEESETRFALVAKESINSKIITSAMRLSVLKLLKHLVENEKLPKSFVIGNHQFSNSKDETTFICIMKEFCITYFGEILKDDITIIITDYKGGDNDE